MVKKLKFLAVLLILSSPIFSQTVTNKICFPDSTAKKIAIDLVQGDSAKAELKKTKELVIQLENKNSTNQRLVNYYVEKCSNYDNQIGLYKQKEVKYTGIITGLESDVKKERKKNKILKYFTIGLGTTTVISIIVGIAN